MVGIGECQSGETAESEYVPDFFEAVIRHRFLDKYVEFRFRQNGFHIGFVDLHFVMRERIFLDPLISQTEEDKIFQTAKQIDCAVVLASVCGLNKGIQSVDILVIHLLQRQVVFPILSMDVFFHIP